MLSLLEPKAALHWLGKQLFNREDPAAFFDPLLQSVSPMWSRQQVPARLIHIRIETADTKTFTLKPSRRWGTFQAGQHVNICIAIDGVRHTRSFSVSSSPRQLTAEGTITLTIKRQRGGLVTNWMHDNLRAGDTLSLDKAFGDNLIPATPEPILCIAGGSGITPILSQLETLSASNWQAPVNLLYFVRTEADVIAASALNTLEQRWPAFSLTIVTTKTGKQSQHFSARHLKTVADIKARRCFICGPQRLMDLAQSLLLAQGLSEDRIHRTYFATSSLTLDPDSVGGDVHFARSDIRVTSADDTPLLDVAEAANLSPQSGCRMGICHQCSCRKISGIVINRLTGKASGPGTESIQLCISIPQGPVNIEL